MKHTCKYTLGTGLNNEVKDKTKKQEFKENQVQTEDNLVRAPNLRSTSICAPATDFFEFQKVVLTNLLNVNKAVWI